MQLTNKSSKKINLKAALTVATTALLGINNVSNASTLASEDSWAFDTALLYYGETERVTAIEGMFTATKSYQDDKKLFLKLTLDTLTGASANGAVAQPQVQTFTRPSGKGQYQIEAGDIPTDDTFNDTRVQLNAQWTQPLSSNYTGSAGLHLSKEYDYVSLGVNGNLAIDFNNKNSTFSIGTSIFQDTFSPEGDIPIPFASMPDQGIGIAHDSTRLKSSDDKTTIDLMLGFTQIINRRMIMSVNYSYSFVDGYLTDPFKILSVVDNNGITLDYLYENRPDERTKQSLFTQAKYHFDKNVIDVSYRYMWDDWDIDSHTVDSRLRIPLTGNSYLEPHLRYYQQSAADFYQPFLNQSTPLPEFASADYRIGEMTAYTLGLKFAMMLENGNELAFKLEYYTQTSKSAGHDAPGVLANLDIYEGIDALIAQVSYSF